MRVALAHDVSSGAPRAPPAIGPIWTLMSMYPSSVIGPSVVGLIDHRA